MNYFSDIFSDKRNIKLFLGLIIVSVALSIIYKEVLILFPFLLDVEILNSITPIMGLFFGPIGVIAISAGNFIADIILGNTSYSVCIVSLFIHFFYAYIPYKLWYTLGNNKEKNAPNLENIRKIIKYICIIFITALIIVFVEVLIYKYVIGEYMDLDFILRLLFTSFNLPIIAGIPVIITCSVIKAKRNFSTRERVTMTSVILGNILMVFIYFVTYFILSMVDIGEEKSCYLSYIITLIITYFVLAVIITLLYFIESNITIPLEKMFNAVKISSQVRDKSDINKVKEICSSIKCENEIKEIANEFCNMIDKQESYYKNISEIEKEREREVAELKLASKIQESILPRKLPDFPYKDNFDIYAKMSAAKGVGGDFYDFFLVNDHTLCFIVADVSGKGVPAALFMMRAKNIIKNRFLVYSDILYVMNEINKKLEYNNETCMFVTAFLALVDLNKGVLTYVNAGHNPPLIKKKNGKFNYLKTKHNCILAIDPNAKFQKQEIQLEKDDVIFVYTDGVIEAVNSNGELYSSNRLINTLNEKYNGNLEEVIPAIRESVDEFCESKSQTDDITMLMFKWNKINKI